MATRDTNAKLAGIGSDAVRAKTGKNWTEWIDALDRAGARTLAHADIAALVHEKFGVGPWWTQMVAVGYEQATGKRVRMQKADGFAAGASKTLDASPAAVFKAFDDSRTRAGWLDDEFTIRKATKPKSLRITWKDGKTWLDVNIHPKGTRRSVVSVQHSRITSARAAERMKRYWAAALGRLAIALG